MRDDSLNSLNPFWNQKDYLQKINFLIHLSDSASGMHDLFQDFLFYFGIRISTPL